MILRFDDIEEIKELVDYLDSKLEKRHLPSNTTENSSDKEANNILIKKLVEIKKNQDEIWEKILELENQHKHDLSKFTEIRESVSDLSKKLDNLGKNTPKKQAESRKKRGNYNNRKFEVYNNSRVPFNKVTVDSEGTIFFIDGRGLKRKINFTLPHLLYLNEIRSRLTSTTATQVATDLGITTNYLSKMIYNLQIGSFDEIMQRFVNNSKKIDVSISKNNTIRVNGIITSFLKEEAYSLLLNIQNSDSGLFETIYTKYKSYRNVNIDECLFYSFCINYDNSDLIKMLSPKKPKIAIENNPQRRRENRGL